jgi:hypothetical protein
MCLDMMEFDGKDEIMQKVSQNGGLYQKLMEYMQLALGFAQMVQPQMAEQIAQVIMATMQGGGTIPTGGANPQLLQTNNVGSVEQKEHHVVEKARTRANEATQPQG